MKSISDDENLNYIVDLEIKNALEVGIFSGNVDELMLNNSSVISQQIGLILIADDLYLNLEALKLNLLEIN